MAHSTVDECHDIPGLASRRNHRNDSRCCLYVMTRAHRDRLICGQIHPQLHIARRVTANLCGKQSARQSTLTTAFGGYRLCECEE